MKRYAVHMNGKLFTTFAERTMAEGFVRMQREKKDWCPKGEHTFAAKQVWTVVDRGSKHD